MRLLLTLAIAMVLATGCAKKDGEGAAGGEAAQVDTSTPEGLGKAIFAEYKAGTEQMMAILKDHPDAATVKPKVEELEKKTIEKMVELGKKRQALPEGDRGKVDMTLFDQMGQLDPNWMSVANAASAHYAGTDADLGAKISGFNVITQYASFELLKKQKPEEAKRLGIE